MGFRLKRTALIPFSHLFPNRVGAFATKRWSKDLIKALLGEATDDFLELLLEAMDLAFYLSKSYRKNIEDFEGRYLFRSADGLVEASATFKNGNMRVHKEAVPDWDVRITFGDSAALRAFIFSRDHDIVNSILKNDVETDGNLNCLFKFGFMARDLSRRLGVE
jgi:hypothetical protein